MKRDCFGFNGRSFSEAHWKVMQHRIENVLEIGSGFSTILFDVAGIHVTSYETDQPLIDALLPRLPRQATRVYCDYPTFPDRDQRYDTAFVDGPGFARNFDGRIHSMLFARHRTSSIFIHEYMREKENTNATEVFSNHDWQCKYVSGGLALIISWTKSSG